MLSILLLQELAQIEDLLNKVEDDGDMVHLVVPPPPFTSMGHRCQSMTTATMMLTIVMMTTGLGSSGCATSSLYVHGSQVQIDDNSSNYVDDCDDDNVIRFI